LFERYWPDCPFTTYHVSETVKYSDKYINILTGSNKEWSERLLTALDKIDEEYVFLLLDDYFLLKKVQNKDFENCLNVLNRNPNAGLLRTFPVPPPQQKYSKENGIGLIDKNRPYSISTQATIWKKGFLMDFLIPTENIWQLELDGSKRTQYLNEDLLSIIPNHKIKAENGNYPYTYLCTAVYKGKWMKEAIKLCKNEGIILDLKYRSVESELERIKRRHYHRFPLFLKKIFDFIILKRRNEIQ
jgi:hypothetical protein